MDSARRTLTDAVQALLHRIPGATRERADELLRGLSGRGVYVPGLRSWLEQCQPALPEPVAAEDLDGLSELGVDVLLCGTRSGQRVGFQVKSDQDLAGRDFTIRLKAQLYEAQSYGISLMVLVFACRPSKENLAKVKYWQSFTLSRQGIPLLCLSPERAAGLFEAFSRPAETAAFSGKDWPDFFQSVGQPQLASDYLDHWPTLEPHQRFLQPKELPQIRSALEEHRLVFLVGPLAVGKTFTALQLLWEAHQADRPVKWVTTSDATPTEGIIPRNAVSSAEKNEFRRRVDALLRKLGSEPGRLPDDEFDVVSRLLPPGALVYIEDPFGKTDDVYSLSLASYTFFDFQRWVDLLEESSARAGCRLLVTSRESLFSRWLADQKQRGKKERNYQVIRLTTDSYFPGPIYRHLILLANAKGLESAEEIADVLTDGAETPYQAHLLIDLLPEKAQVSDAEQVVTGWTGELRSDVERHVAPQNEIEVIALLSILAADYWEEDPALIYHMIHGALELPSEPKEAFNTALQRFSPFFTPRRHRFEEKPRGYKPNHSIVREVTWSQLAAPSQRPFLYRVARVLPEIPPARRRLPFFKRPAEDTWDPHQHIAFVLVELGIAQESETEAAALEKVLFDFGSLDRRNVRRLVKLWHILPNSFRDRFFGWLRWSVENDHWNLREAAACLPRAEMEPADAWRVLEFLFEEPERGSFSTFFEEFPWSYLFLHLDEVPEPILYRLDAWAREKPSFFVYALGEGLLAQWDNLSQQLDRLVLWRSTFFHPQCLCHEQVQKRLIQLIARNWTKAPHSLREIFDFHARSSDENWRGDVGKWALFYARDAPDLKSFALEAAQDHDLSVCLAAFQGGFGGETHRRFTEVLLNREIPGLTAAMALHMVEESGRDGKEPWEKEALERCIQSGGDALRAVLIYESFEEKGESKLVARISVHLPETPLGQPDVIRAAWIWAWLNNLQTQPPLSDEEVEQLLLSLEDPKVRGWCLSYASYRLTALPERLQHFLEEISQTSSEDAKAIQEGARQRPSDGSPQTMSFPVVELGS